MEAALFLYSLPRQRPAPHHDRVGPSGVVQNTSTPEESASATQGGEGSARTPTDQHAFQSDPLGRATNQNAFQSAWLGRSLGPPEHVINQRTTQPRCDGLLKRRSSRKAFQLREGKAPPAPQLTNTRFTPHGSDGASTLPHVQSNNTRFNPHGSDGASTLPEVQSTKTRFNPHGSDGASTLPNVQPNNGRPHQDATVFSKVVYQKKRFN